MTAFICVTCGTQYAPADAPPSHCIICDDERQYVAATGQAWTTLERLQRTHMPTFRYEGELMGVGMAPAFGIDQRALIVPTPEGNVLWDCISLISDAMVDLIAGFGGISAIAISHPHYYTTLVEWSRAFGNIPVYLHEADRQWIMRPDPCITAWTGDTHAIAPGLTLVRTGGHFDGGTILHWAGGASGRGALLTGDLLQVVPDRKHLAFMRSYPNLVPLGARAVEAVAARVAPFTYDTIYGAFWNRVIATGGEAAMATSVTRHCDWLDRPAP